MKMKATRHFTLGKKDGGVLKCKPGDDVNPKDITKEEAQELYEKGLVSSVDLDKKKKAFELEMEIDKVEAEMQKAAKETKEKKDELEMLRKELKGGDKEPPKDPPSGKDDKSK